MNVRPWSIRFHQVRAITRKEFWQIITSPMFLTILGVACFLWSFVYVRYFIEFAERSLMVSAQGREGGNIHFEVFISFLAQMNLLLIFIIPALTMRLFAEERKMKTFDLLMSSPITAFQIVLGKFFAAYLCSIVVIGISFFYIIITSFFADFSWSLILISYFGMLLLAAVYVCLGLIASVITQSAVLSTILGILFNVFIWFFGQTLDIVNHPIAISILEYLLIPQHLENFIKGKLTTSSLVFFFLFITFFIFLITKIIQASKWRS